MIFFDPERQPPMESVNENPSPEGFLEHVHLISDATGETVRSMYRACISQFPQHAHIAEHLHLGIRGERDVESCFALIEQNPGPILATVADKATRELIKARCDELHVPRLFMLDQLFDFFIDRYQELPQSMPGKQHQMDEAYFQRIRAMHYALDHDDGQLMNDISAADILLVGVSRTSKTPTSMYLANRGINVANFPLVIDLPIPESVLNAFKTKTPLPIGLIAKPHRLQEIRRARMAALATSNTINYVDIDRISDELEFAKKLFQRFRVKTFDVSDRSIEETATSILSYQQITKQQR
ncbi:MAG: kinase/pyrophosphorylase [Alphaproteobacteria bacterium]|nr:kinase/pyrophosphorylase [Alphaproteobacteria bacterium]